MNTFTKTVAAAAVASFAWFGGVAAAQQEAPPKIELDALAAQLDLSPEAKARIAPEVKRLNELIARGVEQRQRHLELRTELQETRGRIETALTPEQQRQFRRTVRGSLGFGPGAGMRGSMMRGGMRHPGGQMQGMGGPGAMGSGMGGMGMGPGMGGMGPGMGCDGAGPHGPRHGGGPMVAPGPRGP